MRRLSAAPEGFQGSGSGRPDRLSPPSYPVEPIAAEAAIAFQQALAIARQEQAKALELRAAIRMGRLWQGQGQHAPAYQLVANIYNWFTDGFDTAALQEARLLLEALAE